MCMKKATCNIIIIITIQALGLPQCHNVINLDSRQKQQTHASVNIWYIRAGEYLQIPLLQITL